MANSEYQSWMNKKQDEVTVHISLLESEDGKKIVLNNVYNLTAKNLFSMSESLIKLFISIAT